MIAQVPQALPDPHRPGWDRDARRRIEQAGNRGECPFQGVAIVDNLPGEVKRQPVVPGHEVGGPSGQSVLGILEARRGGLRPGESVCGEPQAHGGTDKLPQVLLRDEFRALLREQAPEGIVEADARGQGREPVNWGAGERPRIQSIDSER